MAIVIRRIRSEEAALLREVRLKALADAPSAFGSGYDAEATSTEDHWRSLAIERSSGPNHATFFAVDGDCVVGIVGGHRIADGTEVELTSMWADPAERGRGIGASLVQTIVDWAEGSPVSLWVTRGNDAAYRLYERLGFVETGDFQALPSDPCKDEIRMRLDPL